MLVTRPEPDAEETVARLAAIGIEGVAAPLLERVNLSPGLPQPEGFAALALTSTNTLRALQDRGVLARYLGLPVFAVGERTAAAARVAGFAEVRAAGGTLAHLAGELTSAGLAGPVFYPTARHQSGNLAAELARAGIMAVTAHVYEMRPATDLPARIVEELRHGTIAAALFYSHRTAGTFATLTAPTLDPEIRARFGVLCLSEQVAAPLIRNHFVRVGLAEHPSELAMMALALSFARAENTA